MSGIPPSVPHRGKPVELERDPAPEETPRPRTPRDGGRRNPCEAAPEPLAEAYEKWMRSSCPVRAFSIAAALPPLIATAMFWYASS